MRHARIKPDYEDTWHHCYNRAAGTRDDRPFGDAEKEVFVRLLKRLAAFYTVRVVSYTFMSNHFHIIFCSYGEWAQTGRHPFADAVARFLAPALPAPFAGNDAAGALAALKGRFARDAAEEAARQGAPDVPAPRGFLLTARRRVRHWADGLAIGSEIFVRETVRRARPSATRSSHRLARSEPAPGTPEPLFCWRRLRPALE